MKPHPMQLNLFIVTPAHQPAPVDALIAYHRKQIAQATRNTLAKARRAFVLAMAVQLRKEVG
jgi:hypothetical protein